MEWAVLTGPSARLPVVFCPRLKSLEQICFLLYSEEFEASVTTVNETATFRAHESDVSALQNILSHIARIGFSEPQACQRLGLANLTDLLWRAVPIYRAEKLAVRDPQASVIDLFLLQGIIPRDELNRLFDPASQTVLVRSGLLLIDEQGRACARASLYPVGNRLIFSDHAWPTLPHPGFVNVPASQVMFIGTDSRWLARATVRRPVGSTLDLCTGSGIHALLAAAHSRRVLAVDINPRAVQCARFNALVSGATNVEVATGNLYEPARGELFDLITANPPFVPSPRNSLQYRDGGHSGEEVQRHIISGLPKHLAPGGMAQIVTEFGERGNEPLADRLREWLDGAPLDIYTLRLREHSAEAYAIGHADGIASYENFLNSVHDWAENLRTQGYMRIVSVLLAFQWSDPKLGAPWERTEKSQPPANDAGHEVAAAFDAERLARKPNFLQELELGRVRRAGPVALLEARVLGREIHAHSQAELLGNSLPILYSLAPEERVILALIEKPLAVTELLALTQGVNLDRKAVLNSLGLLVRRGLVQMIPAHS